MGLQLHAALLCLAVSCVQALRSQIRTSNGTESDELENLTPIKKKLMHDIRRQELVDAGSAVKKPKVEHEVCTMGDSEDCKLNGLPRGKLSFVHPGGDTRCLNGDPYYFEVHPGDSDKLLLFFDGGGACWTNPLYTMSACRRHIIHNEPWIGYFNPCTKGAVQNPFRNYTAIRINYCSGDAHLGHKDLKWKTVSSSDEKFLAVHRGYLNAKAAVDWAKANLAPELSNFALTGSSAGVIGLQVWAPALLQDFKYQKAAIVLEAWMNIVPKGFDSFVLRKWDACDTPLFSRPWMRALRRACKTGSLTMKTVFDSLAGAYPEVPIAQVNSLYDSAQRFYHDLIVSETHLSSLPRAACGKRGAGCDDSGDGGGRAGMGPGKYFKLLRGVVEDRSRYPNYAVFLLSDGAHTQCFQTFGDCDASDWTGPEATRQEVQRWLTRMVEGPLPVQSVCENTPYQGLPSCPPPLPGRLFDPAAADQHSSAEGRRAIAPAAAAVLALVLALARE